jgi:hypothetical protein
MQAVPAAHALLFDFMDPTSLLPGPAYRRSASSIVGEAQRPFNRRRRPSVQASGRRTAVVLRDFLKK